MPGYIVQATAIVSCFHQSGLATLVKVQPRVTLLGQPAVTAGTLVVAPGCPFTNGSSPQPCTTITWSNISGRVRSMGQPLLLQAPVPSGPVSGGVCLAGTIPQGVPTAKAVQVRVIGQ
jgi:hypothetical protein